VKLQIENRRKLGLYVDWLTRTVGPGYMKACSAVVDKDNANFGAEFYKTSCIAFNF